jgi:glucose-6-phosphate dehydrogenase-like protein
MKMNSPQPASSLHAHGPAIADAFVFFGATGDLAYKQIFPALQQMIRRDDSTCQLLGWLNPAGISIS